MEQRAWIQSGGMHPPRGGCTWYPGKSRVCVLFLLVMTVFCVFCLECGHWAVLVINRRPVFLRYHIGSQKYLLHTLLLAPFFYTGVGLSVTLCFPGLPALDLPLKFSEPDRGLSGNSFLELGCCVSIGLAHAPNPHPRWLWAAGP